MTEDTRTRLPGPGNGARKAGVTSTGTPRVVHLSPVPFGGPGGYVGGGERYPVKLAEAMAALTPTTYVTFDRVAHEEQDGPLRRVSLRSRGQLRGSPLNPISARLPAALRGADVVHLHQWESLTANAAAILARVWGARLFVTDHGGFTPNLARALRLHRLAHGLLSVSDFAAGFYPSFGRHRWTILGGVDTDRFAPDDRVRRGHHALFVGRLLPHKGVDVLIEALGPDDALRVVGRPYQPAYLDHLRRLAEGKDVTFVTDASDAQLLAEYRTARAVVLPSLHRPPQGPLAPRAELLGLTLIEAMACGTPVVCTRTGGMPEVPEDGVTGFVVPPLDRPALRAAVHRLTRADDETWRGHSLASRARAVRSFTWDAVARRALAAYARV